MRLSLCIAAYGTLALATASPKLRTDNFQDNFDNPPDANPLLPATAPIAGTAGGALTYQAFNYANLATSEATISPPSPPYTAGSGLTAEVKAGQRLWTTMNSSVVTYTEKSIFYACTIYEAVTAAVVPTTCTIQLTGVKSGSGITVLQELVYDPALLPVNQKFNFTTFADSFSGLKQTNVDLLQSAADPSLVVLRFDNHAYSASLGY